MALSSTQSPDAEMSPGLDPLIRDFVSWVAREPRLYADALDTWRTSCPRLTVWEDAFDRNLVRRIVLPERGPGLEVTDAGRDFITAR